MLKTALPGTCLWIEAFSVSAVILIHTCIDFALSKLEQYMCSMANLSVKQIIRLC